MTCKTPVTILLLIILGIYASVLADQQKDPKGFPKNTRDLLILNQPEEVELQLRKFRMMSGPYLMRIDNFISRIGLTDLRVSGSAQFSVQSFQVLLQTVPTRNLTVIDLRQESHGFLNDMPVSWYSTNDWSNKGLTLAEITKDENQRLNQLLPDKVVTIHQLIHDDGHTSVRDLRVQVHSVSTEEALCRGRQIGYLRIPVTDHDAPDDQQIDRFVSFARQLPPDGWMHIHCAGGMGRTTTFLAMYDMMINASNVSFSDILQRQWMLGGQNIFSNESSSFRKWPMQFEKRLEMLQNFYQYCRSNADHYATSWSQWLNSIKP